MSSGRLATALLVTLVSIGPSCISSDRRVAPGVSCGSDDCTCEPGLANCDERWDTGCEVELSVDPLHCGRCGLDCDGYACVDGVCSCPPELGSCDPLASLACQSDLMTDADHCGACNHGCDGGGCTDGVCGPVELFRTEGSYFRLEQIALGPSQVFVTTDPDLLAVPMQGGEATTLADGARLTCIAFDDQHVYWRDGFRINRLPIAGGPPEFVTDGLDASEWPVSSCLAVGEQALYFITGQSVIRCGKTGNDCTLVASASYAANCIAIDGSHAYWCDSGTTIKRVPLGGGSPEVFATAGSTDVTANRDAVFWTGGADGGVWRRPADGSSPPEQIAGGAERPETLAVDEIHVYWADWSSGSVRRVPVAGGDSTTLAQHQQNVVSMALNDTHLFWATQSGTLMRLQK